MLEIRSVSKTFNSGTPNELRALQAINLTVNDGSFVVMIGTNGSGKSTLLNAVAGSFYVDSGGISLAGEDITNWPEHQRAKLIGRVFQNPFSGTAANMSIAENLALAAYRGKPRRLGWPLRQHLRIQMRDRVSQLNMGLEDRLKNPIGSLSGGQRQALTLLMATWLRPEMLLLDLSVDGSFVEANANKGSRIPREQLAEVAHVKHNVRQYLVELEQQNPTEEPVHQQEQVSTTDPDATYATKGGMPARLGYYDNYLVDNRSCVIVGVQATAARMSQETVAAQDMIARFAQWQGRDPESVAADATYGNGEFLQWLMERGITPYMRTRDSALRKNNPLYGPDRFTYLPESNSYRCPAGQPLNFVGLNVRNRTHAYIGSRKRCGACPQKAQCTTGQYKYLAIHMHEPARQRARDLVNTPAFAHSQRQRRKVEALFAELKNQIGLRRLRLRRIKFVREQFFLAAAAQNIKRLVRFLSQVPGPPVAALA